MKICVVQTRPIAGEIQKNIERHISILEAAASLAAELVVFPELSISSYEPKLAIGLATTQDDSRLDVFQRISDDRKMTIGVGIPIKTEAKPRIGMVIFSHGKPRNTYCKRFLHSDELPYFSPGDRQVFLGSAATKIAPAICYESLLPEHADEVVKSGANVYLASVAKSAQGAEKTEKHFPEIARKYSMPVLMSNCLGPCDDFVGIGRTSVWDKQGRLQVQLDETNEGFLILDTASGEVLKRILKVAMAEPIIRAAKPGDEQGIHEAHMRSIREVCSKDHTEDEIRGWGNRPLGERWRTQVRGSGVWVVECSGAISGFGYIQTKHEGREEEAHLFGLYLAPEVLGKGFGSKLIRLMLDKARADGARKVTLTATITAHEFYKSHGFRDNGPMTWNEIGGSRVRGFPMALDLK